MQRRSNGKRVRGKQNFRRRRARRAKQLRQEMDGLVTAGARNMEGGDRDGEMCAGGAESCLMLVWFATQQTIKRGTSGIYEDLSPGRETKLFLFLVYQLQLWTYSSASAADPAPARRRVINLSEYLTGHIIWYVHDCMMYVWMKTFQHILVLKPTEEENTSICEGTEAESQFIDLSAGEGSQCFDFINQVHRHIWVLSEAFFHRFRWSQVKSLIIRTTGRQRRSIQPGNTFSSPCKGRSNRK